MSNSSEAILKQLSAALEHDRRINLHRYPIHIDFCDGAIVMEGDVADIAAKKLALEHAGALEGSKGVVDRLHVVPAEGRGDGAIRDSLVGFLERQTEFVHYALSVVSKGCVELLREPATQRRGAIEVSVADGVITLEGEVESLTHKRLAGVLAWWTPGRRDVLNALVVQPDEEDNEGEILDALRTVLESDPLVQADQIRASCRGYVVTLQGYVRSEEEKRQAELDAWYLFGVDCVINHIEVRG